MFYDNKKLKENNRVLPEFSTGSCAPTDEDFCSQQILH